MLIRPLFYLCFLHLGECCHVSPRFCVTNNDVIKTRERSIVGEKLSDQATQIYATRAPAKRGEKGNSSSLRCKRFLSTTSNKQSNKKTKLKSFNTESHSSFNSFYPSKFDFLSPLKIDWSYSKHSWKYLWKDFQKTV